MSQNKLLIRRSAINTVSGTKFIDYYTLQDNQIIKEIYIGTAAEQTKFAKDYPCDFILISDQEDPEITTKWF